MKQVAVDLVILNERAPSYLNELQSALETQLRMSQSRPRLGADHARGAVFLLRTDLIPEETRALLSSVARIVLVGQRGSLADQLERLRVPALALALNLRPSRPLASADIAVVAPASLGLEFFNGLGGFDAQGREYVTILAPGQSTPAPWINVIANPHFGFQVATDGSGFTWSLNSREHQITPWSNDPVSDRPGEALYLRDEESGEVWGPTAAPIRDPGSTYIARHGYGYSRFELSARDIELNLCMFVPMDAPIKISHPEDPQHVEAPAAADNHDVRGMGARHGTGNGGAVHPDRARCAHGRLVRPQSVGCRIRFACRFRGSRPDAKSHWSADRTRISRPPWHARACRPR
jgi:cyclic beta-1,2-glucan synthetase